MCNENQSFIYIFFQNMPTKNKVKFILSENQEPKNSKYFRTKYKLNKMKILNSGYHLE